MNKIRIAGAAAGVVLVSGVVLQVSSAAFTGETTNSNNAWDAGTVILTNDLGATAMYASQSNITPGYSETRCIEVTYTGTVVPTDPVTFDAVVTSTAGGPTEAADNDGLANDLDVTVTTGESCDALTDLVNDVLTPVTGAPAPLFTGTLASFHDNARSTEWTPTGTNDVQAFSFTVELPDGVDADDAPLTPNGAQGDSATAAFTWTASS